MRVAICLLPSWQMCLLISSPTAITILLIPKYHYYFFISLFYRSPCGMYDERERKYKKKMFVKRRGSQGNAGKLARWIHAFPPFFLFIFSSPRVYCFIKIFYEGKPVHWPFCVGEIGYRFKFPGNIFFINFLLSYFLILLCYTRIIFFIFSFSFQSCCRKI